jgi:serine/threonine protein kinase
MQSHEAQPPRSEPAQASTASTLPVTAPPKQPAAAAAAAATADQQDPQQTYQTLSCGEQVKLCCHSMSGPQQWAADGRQLELVVQGLLGVGGNAEVYQVELVDHSAAAAAAGTDTAASQQQADTGFDSRAAAAATWWAELGSCKAAAASAAAAAAAGAAPAPGSSCSYLPRQHFALKVPRPYHSMPPAVQQRMGQLAYLLNSYSVLQKEHQLLSRVADCPWVLHSHAYGVVTYGALGIQQLPCILLELADGSAQQRLEEYQAEAAAAAEPPCRPVGLPDGEVHKIIRRVLCGLDSLLEANVVWKDMKPSNLMLITRYSYKGAVLCDFGSGELVGADGLETTPMLAGAEAFTAPELKYGRRVGPACDVWGVGCLLLALRLGREVPLLPDEEPSDAAASWDAAAVLQEFEGELAPLELAFVTERLAYDPSMRPSAFDLGMHAYMDQPPASLQRSQSAMLRTTAMLSQILAAVEAGAFPGV